MPESSGQSADVKLPPSGEVNDADQENLRPTPLVHILTPEFHDLDPADFNDIVPYSVERAAPEHLQAELFGPRLGGKMVMRYQTGTGQWLGVAVNPEHFISFARHVPALAETAFAHTLQSKDRNVRKVPGQESKRARTDEDKLEANRAGIRDLMKKEKSMEDYLREELSPRVELLDRFLEMTNGSNYNLARGSRQAVSERFEHLRDFIFGDMLDAIGGRKDWDEAKAQKAVRIIQKRLYIDSTPGARVNNFAGMLRVAQAYYGHMEKLVRDRLEGIHAYYARNPISYDSVLRVDFERQEVAELVDEIKSSQYDKS